MNRTVSTSLIVAQIEAGFVQLLQKLDSAHRPEKVSFTYSGPTAANEGSRSAFTNAKAKVLEYRSTIFVTERDVLKHDFSTESRCKARARQIAYARRRFEEF